jgi:protein involved in polysaccharide export with SLBB domain
VINMGGLEGRLMRRIALAAVLVTLLPLVAEGQDGWAARARLIGPGHVLSIAVSNIGEMSRMVCPDGKISLPLLNDVRAAGLTPPELEGVLTERLRDFMPSPEVSVGFMPIEKGSKIFILHREGRMSKRIPFNYNLVAGEQKNSFCPGQGDILILP